MRLLHGLRDPHSRLSLARRLRSRRFDFFRGLLARLPPPISILDVGGTQDFWESMGFVAPESCRIAILNVHAPASRHANMETIAGDACQMDDFEDGRFDIVFSNSVI